MAERVAGGRLDEDHLRAGVGAEAPGERGGGGGAEFDYTEVVKHGSVGEDR
jgi:hypothetical protein